MSMNWHQRRHGWTCSECGTFNEEDNFNCDSEECEKQWKDDGWDCFECGMSNDEGEGHLLCLR